MQRQGGTVDSFTESVNIDQGSAPNTSTNQQTSFNMNPVESRLSGYSVASSGLICGSTFTHDVQRFGSWSSGESSSGLTPRNEMTEEGMKTDHGWSSPYRACSSVGPRSEERRFEPSSILPQGRHSMGHGPQFLRGSSSTPVPQSLNLSAGYLGNNVNNGQDAGTRESPNLWNPGRSETVQAYYANASSESVVTSSASSGCIAEEDNAASGSSLGGLGLSCKRKALEGTSGGSSSCFTQVESGLWDMGASRCDASNNSLSLSTPSENSSGVSLPEQPNPSFGVGMRSLASEGFSSSSMSGNTNTENLSRNWGRRVDPGYHQESTPSSLSSRRGNTLFSDSLDSRPSPAVSANTSSARDTPYAMHLSSLSRNLHSVPWSGASSSRSGRLSGSFMSGERGTTLPEEPSLRSIGGNNMEHSMFVPSTETRNMVHDPTTWSLATGSSSGGIASSSRTGSASAWTTHHNSSTNNQQRFLEFAPWSLFPSADSEPGGHNGHFPPLSSGASSSSQEAPMPVSTGSSSQIHHQPHRRSAFVIERQGDDVLGMPRSLHALATDIDGRHRLISEVCVLNILCSSQVHFCCTFSNLQFCNLGMEHYSNGYCGLSAAWLLNNY